MPNCPKCFNPKAEVSCTDDRVDHQPLIKYGKYQLYCSVCKTAWDDWSGWDNRTKEAIRKIREMNRGKDAGRVKINDNFT